MSSYEVVSVSEVKRSEIVCSTLDGWAIFIRSFPAEGKGRPVVVLLHAMMANGRSLCHPARDSIGRVFHESNWNVYCPDFRGHGASSRGSVREHPWSYDDLVRYDVPAIIRIVKEQCPDSPICIVGHSLGGHVAAASALLGLIPEPTAWVFLGVNLWEPYRGHGRRRRLVKHGIISLFEGVSRGFGYFPARRAGLGSADESLPYVRDLARFWRTGSWGPVDAEPYRADSTSLQAPVLGVYGRGDRWMAPLAEGERWLLSVCEASFETWESKAGEEGLTRSPDHMGLACDPLSRPVWLRLEAWLARQIALDLPES